MGGGADQAGQEHVGVAQPFAGVGEVVGVHGVDRAGQLDHVRAALEQAAHHMDRVQLGADEGVRGVRAEPVGELRLRRGRLQGGGDPALCVAGGVGALAAGLGQDLMRPRVGPPPPGR